MNYLWLEKSLTQDCRENINTFHFKYIISKNRSVYELINKKGGRGQQIQARQKKSTLYILQVVYGRWQINNYGTLVECFWWEGTP
jgi:hypothetical protein